MTATRCQERSLVFPQCVPAGWECGAGGGWEPQKRNQHLLSSVFAGEELCLQCPARGTQRAKHTSRGWALGFLGSAGMDVDKGLPTAPGPGAALNRHLVILQPGQTPLTPQNYPKEQLTVPGNVSRVGLQRGSDSNSWC